MNEFTPLSWAANTNSNPEVIKAYIKAGLDVEERGENGWTPLMSAATGNSNPEEERKIGLQRNY